MSGAPVGGAPIHVHDGHAVALELFREEFEAEADDAQGPVI